MPVLRAVTPRFGVPLALAVLVAPLSAHATTVNFAALPTSYRSAVEQAGMRVAAEVGVPLLYVLNFNGIGVKGGLSDTTLDPDESVRFTFASPATAVGHFVQYANDVDGDGQYGEAWVEGYGADGGLLGVGTVSGTGTKNVSALFGDVPLSGFRVLTRDGERQRIASVTFDRLLDSEDAAPPAVPALRLAGANPVRGAGVLAYELPQAGDVDVALYDIQGRHVQDLVRGAHPAGAFRTSFEARGLESGIYFAVLRVDGEPRGKVKLTVLR